MALPGKVTCMAIYVTTDQHWGHANILKYCQRNFETINAHDEELTKAWNRIVHDDDIVYHLGDVTLGNPKFASQVFKQLNGVIRVLGYPWHHDARWIKSAQHSRSGPVEIEQPVVVLERVYKSGEVWLPAVLCHYPFEVWDRKHYGAIHFHGHVHGELPRVRNRQDVGVDVAFKLLGEYRPFRLEEAIELAIQETRRSSLLNPDQAIQS